MLLVLRGELGFEVYSLWIARASIGLLKPLAELGEEGKKGADLTDFSFELDVRLDGTTTLPPLPPP